VTLARTVPLPHVVVLGGGFGGLYAARSLARAKVDVTVVDRRNHHIFQPLLYQVAACALNPGDVATPIRRILRRQKNASVIMADARSIDTAEKKVVLDAGEISYDYLIVATGATHSYLGHAAWEEHAPGLKTLEDALAIRTRVLLAYEAAEREEDADRRARWLTFVIVGGGATGVELAGALSEIARNVLRKDFRKIDPASARVLLLEAGPRLLPALAADLSEEAKRRLEKMGVLVRLGSPVTNIDAEGVELGGERVRAATVLWAAGVAASPIARSLGVPLDRAGRVRVERDLSVPGAPTTFVVGDLAAFEQDGALVPGVAGAAVQGGRHTAKNIERLVRGEATLPFRYVDKGSLATIGRAAAVAQFGRVHLRGYPAWIAWLFIHIVLLIGFRNRVLVLLQWAWEYWTYERGPRLITGGSKAALLSRTSARD
jgi:NADH:ubiquinone reductase (H+-translocating)